MEIYIGTSGWYYNWNKDKTLDWYVANTGFNIIELNASFYRFPFPNQIKSWAKKSKNLRWIVKVNRIITHLYRFNKNAILTFKKFIKLFEPLNDFIDFYLFQLPPSFKTNKNIILKNFLSKIKRIKNIKNKILIEYRNKEWFSEEWVKWTENLNCIFVSVDSPMFSPFIAKTKDIIYLRMHGRQNWYAYNYKENELSEIKNKIVKLEPKKFYILFNNDEMFKNGKQMKEIMEKK